MCSSLQHQVWNSAELAHFISNLPFSQSQLKLPLLLEVAGDSAMSGVLPHALLMPSHSSGVGGCISKQSVKGGALGPVITCSHNAGGRQKHGNNGILEGTLNGRKIIRNLYWYCCIYAIFFPLKIPFFSKFQGFICAANLTCYIFSKFYFKINNISSMLWFNHQSRYPRHQ